MARFLSYRAGVSRLTGVLAAVVCLTVASTGALPVAAVSETGDLERKREQARQRESTVRHALDVAHASEAELTRRLERLAADIATKRAEAEAARIGAEEAAASVERITGEISALRATLLNRRAVFNRRAVKAYMGGDGRAFDQLSVAGELLALPRDFSDAARRAALVNRVSHQDGDALGQLADTQAELAVQEAALVVSRDQAKARASASAAALRAVTALKAEQEKTRVALQSRIASLAAEADALAVEQAKLEQLIRERLEALARARAERAAREAAAGRSPLASRRVNTGTGVSTAGFVWPVEGFLTSGFGPRWGRMHTGIDIAAPGGTPIVASKPGDVLYAGWLGGYGNLVALDHGDSLVTLYAHQSRIGVVEGQVVDQGDPVGFVGTTGHSTGNHLHFEVRIDTKPVDPRKYLP